MPDFDAVFDGTNADRLMTLEDALRDPQGFVDGLHETRSLSRRLEDGTVVSTPTEPDFLHESPVAE